MMKYPKAEPDAPPAEKMKKKKKDMSTAKMKKPMKMEKPSMKTKS
jgi:hypothetical protein